MSKLVFGPWYLQQVSEDAPGITYLDNEPGLCAQLIMAPQKDDDNSGNFQWIMSHQKVLQKAVREKQGRIITKRFKANCPVNNYQDSWKQLSDLDKITASIPKVEKNAHCTLYESMMRKSKFEGNWSIVETNYKDFLIVYSCREKEALYVFTRKPDSSEMDK